MATQSELEILKALITKQLFTGKKLMKRLISATVIKTRPAKAMLERVSSNWRVTFFWGNKNVPTLPKVLQDLIKKAYMAPNPKDGDRPFGLHSRQSQAPEFLPQVCLSIKFTSSNVN